SSKATPVSSTSSPADTPREKPSRKEAAAKASDREADPQPRVLSAISRSPAIRGDCRVCPRPSRENASRTRAPSPLQALPKTLAHILPQPRDHPIQPETPSRRATPQTQDQAPEQSQC